MTAITTAYFRDTTSLIPWRGGLHSGRALVVGLGTRESGVFQGDYLILTALGTVTWAESSDLSEYEIEETPLSSTSFWRGSRRGAGAPTFTPGTGSTCRRGRRTGLGHDGR
jgi:hypothetical protein